MRYPVPALWRFHVAGVHDADSISAMVDRGVGDRSLWSIRLKDVFAPELHEPGGRECRDFVLGWLADHGDGSEWPFLVETFRTPRSDVEVTTFGRYVGVVTAWDGASLNDDVRQYVAEQGFGPGVT